MGTVMQRLPITAIGGLNLYVNPLEMNTGEVIRAVNVQSSPFLGKSKRTGYSTYLGTADGSAITNLFTWEKDASTFYNYRASGSSLFYSLNGTGAWTLAANGTIGAGRAVGHAVLGTALVICDGVGSTRHTTSGTSFTDSTLAPILIDVEQYQNRIYGAGTASDAFFSTTNDPTNWNTSGTSDSSSLTIPGGGRLGKLIKVSDKLHFTKTNREMYRWDGYSLVDMATNLGPSSIQSVAKTEDFAHWLNRLGHFGYGGNRPQLLSNAVQAQFYNPSGSAVAGTVFDSAPGGVYKYDYLLSLGSVTDDVTGETISNTVLKYNYQKNEYLNDSLASRPTAFLTYKDRNGVEQSVFGDSTGQCYQFDSSFTDNGSPISAVLELFTDCKAPEYEKKFQFLDLFFNPGCEARVQVAIEKTFHKQSKKWIDVGDCSSGHKAFRFPTGSRGEFLFLKISDTSRNTPFIFYGAVVSYELQER